MKRRGLLSVILIYVALDLSLPAMPGAFVFDAGDSVESTQVNRGRASAEVVVLPTLARDPFILSRPRVDAGVRLAPASEPAPLERAVVIWLPRATLDSAPSPEDPR
jgi:hypothetical protein